MRYDSLIEQYAQGADKLSAAIAGLLPADLKAAPPNGGWTIQQIILHLLDSDLIGAERMKRIVAQDNPTLMAYDQGKFASSLFYDAQPVEQVVAMFGLNRRLMANILRRLAEPAFDRIGTHNERGRVTLAQQLEGYAKHLEHHLKFIEEKRAKLGKPLR